jgi:hypothetical protein
LRFERADGDDFPHLYAPLPTTVVSTLELPAIYESPTRRPTTAAFDACVRPIRMSPRSRCVG